MVGRDKQPTEGIPGLLKGLFKGRREAPEQTPPDEAPAQAAEAAAEQQPAAPAAEYHPPDPANLAPAAGNALYELYCRLRGMPVPIDPAAVFHLAEFIGGGTEPDEQQRRWLAGLEVNARNLLKQRLNEEEPPVDAEPVVKLTADKMQAWVFVLPPLFGGAGPTPEDLGARLRAAGVTFGLDQEALEEICAANRFFRFIQVARGEAPVDGEDGRVVERYPREIEIRLKVRDDNTIDYKDLGWLQTIREGETVCDIVEPTKGTPGCNVLGTQLRAKDGRRAVVPMGQGTRLNEEETALVATQDGVVSFQAGRFRVDPLLIVQGNVDTAVGHLDVVGDVLVHGDVLEGFALRATGNITVQGMVEGATIEAGGDIQVGRGVNGNSHGTMKAAQEVRCKFIENATVRAGGKIICDNIINSEVASDDAIQVTTGRGAIIGGQVTAMNRIDALSIGNQSNRNIVIHLGNTANFLRDKKALEQKKKELAATVDSMDKDIRFLELSATVGDDATLKKAEDLKLKQSVQKMQLANVERQLAVMETREQESKTCRLRAEAIYPPVQITIGDAYKVLRQMAFSAILFNKDGEVVVGNG